VVLATEQLAAALIWKAKQSIAEIGVGMEEMTVAAAERVAPSGHVFSTALDPNRLADIKANVTKRKLANVTIVKAGESRH
jgi:precorrin-6B methylase 2